MVYGVRVVCRWAQNNLKRFLAFLRENDTLLTPVDRKVQGQLPVRLPLAPHRLQRIHGAQRVTKQRAAPQQASFEYVITCLTTRGVL